jgi:hypothetical protein
MRLSVPGAVLADEAGAGKVGSEGSAIGEGEAERGGVRAECAVRSQGPGDEIGSLRFDAGVEGVAIVTVEPAIEAARLHHRHVVGHEVAAELVALVDRGLEIEADRVAQAGSVDAGSADCGVDLPDPGAATRPLVP